MTRHRIRNAEGDDAAAVLRMNDAEVTWTSPMDEAYLQRLARVATCYRVAEVGGRVAAFLLAMRDGCGYENENFAWFEARYKHFLYVDRVVVDRKFGGQQLGSTLYRDALRAALAERLGAVVCEYSRVPRNLPSQKFHARQGFREVGRRPIPGTNKVVSMQWRATSADPENESVQT